MKGHGALLVLAVVLGGFAAGLTMLFKLRLSQGDIFPEYSSLRADPLGTRALHDSLARLPGMTVERSFKPVDSLPSAPPRTILVAGVLPQAWSEVTREEFDALDGAVRAGSRLVIALRARTALAEEERRKAEAEKQKREVRVETKEKQKEPQKPTVDLRLRWGAAVNDRRLMDRSDGASRTAEDTAASLPARVGWQSDTYFSLEPDAGWRVLYRRGNEPVLVERQRGRGTIVLAADSYFLSNEALQTNRPTALLAWVVGQHSHVLFDEAHHGIVAQPGVAALARRYGLAGAFFTLLLLAALFVWRRMALFVPPADEADDEVALAYHPAAGLEALLRRAVPPNELAATCVDEWKPAARESERKRVEVALAAAPKNSPAVVLYNLAVRALKKR